VTLRDADLAKSWSGKMHASREEAEADSQRPAGAFEGKFVAVAELREVTADVAEEIGAEISSNPGLFREAHRRTLKGRAKASRTEPDDQVSQVSPKR
jgi:hypothetical protein